MKAFLFSFLFPFSLFAQQTKTLDDCISLALKQNPAIRNSHLRIKEVRMDYMAAVGDFLPRVSASAEVGRSYGRSIDPTTNAYTHDTFDEGTVGLDMTLSLFEGFSRINKVRFEQLNRKRSNWELKDQENRLSYQVADVYYKSLLEDKMAELAREQSGLSERYLKQMQKFTELGLKSVSDLQEIKARCEGDLYRCQSRENSLSLTLLQLKQLMNVRDTTVLVLQDTITYEELPSFLLPCTENLYARSLSVMPSLRMIELQQKAFHKEYAVSGGQFSPSVYARFSISSRSPNGFSTQKLNDNLGKYVGIGLSFPLLNGLERLSVLRKQKLNIYRLQNEKELEEQQLLTEVKQTVLSLRAGYTEHRQALLQLKAETLVLKESERKWEEGLISVFQLMEARNRFIAAKAELIRVRLQVEMLMRLERYYRIGTFETN